MEWRVRFRSGRDSGNRSLRLAAKMLGATSYQKEPPVAAFGKSRKIPAGDTYLSVAASARVTLCHCGPTCATAAPSTAPITGKPSELPGLNWVALAYELIAIVVAPRGSSGVGFAAVHHTNPESRAAEEDR